MASCPKLHLLLFLHLLLLTQAAAEDWTAVASQQPRQQQQQQLQSVLVDDTRRRLNSFRICALCTCCGGPKGLCLPSPCCYAINCNIPNRPFGFCSFTPKTCNCFGCHL